MMPALIIPDAWGHDAAVMQRVQVMQALIRDGSLHDHIRERAAHVIRQCPTHSLRCHCMALSDWVRRRVAYVRDPHRIEAMHHPATWTERRIRAGEYVWGDCDDMSIYLASLLAAIGIRSELRVVGRGRHFHHVYVFACGMHLDPTVEAGSRLMQMGRIWRFPAIRE
jgi:hypothetical protein